MGKIDMLDTEVFKIVHSDEYKRYLAALCRHASTYVSKIRIQFAEKAFEKYADPSIRRLVLEYGEERERLDESRLRDFKFASEYGRESGFLEDDCLNRAKHFGEAINFLFDIKWGGE